MLWKDIGWGTVVFLAALSGIDPQLYEAAWIDGASRVQQVWHITVPQLATVIVIVLVMNLAKMFNMFQSVFVMYNTNVLAVSDVIETYVYRRGILSYDFGFATAVGLVKSVISLVLVLMANKVAKWIQGESIF
jgi:putative aldouronate transport system permease protein